MNCTINAKDLLAALKTVAPAVPSKTTYPILQNVQITVTKWTLILRTTDTELHMVSCMKLKGLRETGSIMVNFKDLLKFVTQIADTNPGLIIWVEGDYLHVQNPDDLTVRFAGSSLVENFPTLPEFPPAPAFTPTPDLPKAIEAVAWAAGTDEVKPWLQGIQLGGGKAVACNGAQIATHPCALPFNNVVIPARLAARMAAKLSDNTKVAIGTWDSVDWVFFMDGNTHTAIRSIGCQYPDVMRHVPQTYPTVTTTELTPLKKTLGALPTHILHFQITNTPADTARLIIRKEVKATEIKEVKVRGKMVEREVKVNRPAEPIQTIDLPTPTTEGLIKGARYDLDSIHAYNMIKPALQAFGKAPQIHWNFSGSRTAVKLTSPESLLTVYTLPMVHI